MSQKAGLSKPQEFLDQIIQRLPPEISNKIAAGEVVQRPASVLKELLDNAIDSGASKIQIILENSGRSLVQVIDDGCGLSKIDIPLCFERHATSKIHHIDDLNNLRTLGFRGEAMASIASVAHVLLKSKRVEDTMGHEFEMWGGEVKQFRPVATDNGTSVAVRNLFFNVPARRAFLKTDTTEFRHCLLIFQQIAIANPAISFEMVAEMETIYSLPPQDLRSRITQLFGKSYKASLIEIREPAGFVEIHGFLADPKLAKKSRGEQFLFVNGRPFSHRFITHQVLNQYHPWTRQDEYPFFAIFYELDPSLVDVNVHPSKMEVRFEDERTVLGLTRSVVKRALNERFSIPEFSLGGPDDAYNNTMKHIVPNFDGFNRGEYRQVPSRINVNAADMLFGNPEKKQHADQTVEHKAVKRSDFEKSNGFWQLHNQYILTQTLTGLFIIDQHAAHKRILFEKALLATESGMAGTQQLLFPKMIDMSASDFSLLKSIESDMQRLGFNISLISGNSVLVQGVPADIQTGDEKSLLESILNQYKEYNGPLKFDSRQKLALAYASKTAIPRGKKLSINEMEVLIDQLFACEQPYFDPIQKPTIVYIPLDDIRSRFR